MCFIVDEAGVHNSTELYIPIPDSGLQGSSVPDSHWRPGRKMEPIEKTYLDVLLHMLEFHNQHYVCFLILPLASSVTSHKLFKQTKPEFPHLANEVIYICLAGF